MFEVHRLFDFSVSRADFKSSADSEEFIAQIPLTYCFSVPSDPLRWFVQFM